MVLKLDLVKLAWLEIKPLLQIRFIINPHCYIPLTQIKVKKRDGGFLVVQNLKSSCFFRNDFSIMRPALH